MFSSFGEKYLKALLKYHIVANQTLYSDAYYKADTAVLKDVPKGVFHVRVNRFRTMTTLIFELG